jgi:diguanylate cyclase (GGDEF)-like protein
MPLCITGPECLVSVSEGGMLGVEQPGGEQELSAVLTEFARTMVTDFPIEAILDRLVKLIVDILAITAAGVTLIEPGAVPRYVAASDPSALRFEKLQTELGEGPCLLAYNSGEAVQVPDLRTETRFPEFAPRALSAGMQAVFTFPLHHGDRRLGALDLYRDTPGELSAHSQTVAQTLADVVASYLHNAQARDDLQDSSDRSRQASLHDGLTGLPNRVLLLERLEHAFLRSRRTQRTTAVYFIDLDLFKAVNDTHGHGVGDELLIAVAGRLGGLLRPPDTLARLSGDEFVAVCEDLDSTDHAGAIGARITAALHRPFPLSTAEVTISASIGIACTHMGDQDAEQLLHDADMAMYQAKHKGGARQQLFDPLEQHVADRQAGLLRDLQHAVERHQLHLDYQPIVSTADGALTGFEALLRWRHPQRGLIPPTTLIPLAEQSHLIDDIGRWVLQRALDDRDRWLRERAIDVTMAVNVSAQQLMAPDFVAVVAAMLGAADTDPPLLTLEITESVFIQDSDRALVVLGGLKDLGVTLALDDFGTGYSSLTYLQRFPIDIIKIDRTFTAAMAGNATTRIIVESVVDLAHKLGMTIVAEGVETAEQHEQVSALGCDFSQGYYFAKPLPRNDAEQLLGLDSGQSPGRYLPITSS